MKKQLRIALMPLALVVLSGCEGLPGFKSSTSDSGVDQSAATTGTGGRAGRTGDETHELRQAIDLLQDGNLKQGRVGLVSVLERNPGNQTARSLLRQIDTDPKALLGEEHTLYTVRPGDTLGELAERLLGDAVSFLALARYNDIQRPKVLHVGQTLKIPVTQRRVAEPAAPAEEPAADTAVEPAMAPAVVLEPTTEPDEAPTQDDADAASGESSAAPGERATSPDEAATPAVEAASPAVEAASPAVEAASPAVEAASPAVEAASPADEAATPPVEAATPAVEAATPAVEGEETAIDDAGPRFESAAPAAPAAPAATASGADAARIAEYHQAALVHFRNQELDEAIALWDRVLALDPGFEPARGYRMRAQELKRRLEALETR